MVVLVEKNERATPSGERVRGAGETNNETTRTEEQTKVEAQAERADDRAQPRAADEQEGYRLQCKLQLWLSSFDRPRVWCCALAVMQPFNSRWLLHVALCATGSENGHPNLSIHRNRKFLYTIHYTPGIG